MTNLPKEYFQRYDESSDFQFYDFPRKVVHIDEGAIGLLREHYAATLQDGDVLLDLMSSWRSHLPENLKPARVYGLGMNAEEMADNPQLDEFVVHSLNDNPKLPYDDAQFDAVLCAVSVQYLINPIAVFSDVSRVLKPGGRFIVSFSNRCFPTKAVAIWLNMTDMQHVALVASYFEAAHFANIQTTLHTKGKHDPMFIVSGQKMPGQTS